MIANLCLCDFSEFLVFLSPGGIFMYCYFTSMSSGSSCCLKVKGKVQKLLFFFDVLELRVSVGRGNGFMVVYLLYV